MMDQKQLMSCDDVSDKQKCAILVVDSWGSATWDDIIDTSTVMAMRPSSKLHLRMPIRD